MVWLLIALLIAFVLLTWRFSFTGWIAKGIGGFLKKVKEAM